MSHWNYRIVKTKENGWITYAIHEVYYFDEGVGWTERPIGPSVVIEDDMTEKEAITSIKKMLQQMLDGCDKGILDKT